MDDSDDDCEMYLDCRAGVDCRTGVAAVCQFENVFTVFTSTCGMSRVRASLDDDGASPDNMEGHTAKPEVDWVESDMDQRSQLESDPGESDPEETSGTESQQGEDTTVQEAVTPETDTNMDEEDLPLEPVADPEQHDVVQDSGTTNSPSAEIGAAQESMDMEQNLVSMVSVSDQHDQQEQAMETEMVESATMKDVMEKCQKSEPEQLVAELCVEAHFVQREVDMEVCHDKKIRESDSDLDGNVTENSMKMTMDISPGTCDTNKSVDNDLHGVEKLHDSDEHVVRDIVIESGEEASLDTSSSGQEDSSTVAKSGQIKKSTKTLKTAKDSQKVARVQRKRKDLESPGLPNSKNPRAPQTPEPKSDSKKSSPKLVAKSAPVSLKSPPSGSPQPVKSNVGGAKKSASKNVKNVSNKKKIDISTSSSVSPQSSHKATPEKKSSPKKVDPAKEKEQEIVKARKQLDLLQSVSSISVAPHLTTIEARPVILSSDFDSGSEDTASQRSVPAPRRSLPTSKYSAENKTVKDVSSKEAGPSKLARPQTGATQGKPKMGIPKGIPKPQSRPGGLPRPSSTGTAKRSIASSIATAKVSTSTEPKVAKTSLKAPLTSRLAPRKSVGGTSTTDGTAPGTSDRPQISRPSSAPGSRLSKPKTSTSTTLQKTDRSMSMGSDTAGHKSQSENQSGSSSAPVTPRKPNLGPRRSLAEPGLKRPEPGRRATLALPSASRLTGPKGTSKGLAPIATSTPAPKRNSNQNKNKPVRNGGAPSQPSGTIQRPNQPDLVTNAISNSAASQEVERLEALCEARTKELNKIKIQLRKRSTGFEALAVLIKYLTEELSAFSCPQVTAQLADAQDHLQRASVHLEELTNQRDALIAEIQCIKQQNADDTGKLVSSHQVALQALEQRLTTERDDQVKKLIEKHSKDLAALKSFHERNIREFETERDNLLAEKEAEYTEELTRRKQEFDKDSADLHQEQESKLTEITMRFESIKINLLEKVEFLRTEGEDLRRREASMLEKCQRDSEYKIQHGLAQYKQEVDSLRTVMELRNAEIHDLRRRNVENEKRLEEIPKSRDEIKSLKQKVENLQAIIDIRADNEKQLSEKHQVLLRKYDKDSKAMKRISMDNEELVWRLSMSDMSSSDSFRRSVSHSPTNSECSTPEPTRRRKSPMPHSPRSPVDPKTSSPVTNLKRSGTYDLLNQDFDEESNNIRPDL